MNFRRLIYLPGREECAGFRANLPHPALIVSELDQLRERPMPPKLGGVCIGSKRHSRHRRHMSAPGADIRQHMPEVRLGDRYGHP
jgi:hypothetical protein